jgi:hypothetical protein
MLLQVVWMYTLMRHRWPRELQLKQAVQQMGPIQGLLNGIFAVRVLSLKGCPKPVK